MERILLVVLFILNSYPQFSLATGPTKATSAGNSEEGDKGTAKSDSEEEDDSKTFTDKVKSIRSVSGDYDVFFVEHFGPYAVPYSLPNSKSNKGMTPDQVLAEALKKGLPVTVTIDTKTDTLTAIETEVARAPASRQEPTYDLPPDMDYLRDIIKNSSKP